MSAHPPTAPDHAGRPPALTRAQPATDRVRRHPAAGKLCPFVRQPTRTLPSRARTTAGTLIDRFPPPVTTSASSHLRGAARPPATSARPPATRAPPAAPA